MIQFWVRGSETKAQRQARPGECSTQRVRGPFHHGILVAAHTQFRQENAKGNLKKEAHGCMGHGTAWDMSVTLQG